MPDVTNNFLVGLSMTTYIVYSPLRRHLVDRRFDEGSSVFCQQNN